MTGATPTKSSPPKTNARSALNAWLRALERTAPIERNPHVTLPIVIDRLADHFESAPALASPETLLSFRDLSQAANRYARWAIRSGLQRGEVVCLLMHNCPEYLAIWLGLTRAGLTVALLNTHLAGEPLAHSLRIAAPRAIVAGAGFSEHVTVAARALDTAVPCWTHGEELTGLPRLDEAAAHLAGGPLAESERPCPVLDERALYIYTSGTTGLPKAAVVSHRRLMHWSNWFAGLMDITPQDRLYNCLPMYHSVGGVVATGAALVAGASVVLRRQFSASRFWADIRAERCTIFQYIGELCRYLVNCPPSEDDAQHSLRLACGNGLRKEVWETFQSRFRVPQILEYYASTEGNVSLYNCEGRPGAIGRIPPFLMHRYPVTLIRCDARTATPERNADGQCIVCAPGETGEAIGRISDSAGTTRFEGYVDTQATEHKVLRNVFATGDAWYRTGDLMRKDERGFFYFVDRIGDTFRWKGENVSTTEVAAVLSGCSGVREVTVYGVTVPGTEGRAGMAALVAKDTFDPAIFRLELAQKLPQYARPLFLRIVPSLGLTGTFKLQKQNLAREGYDPALVRDTLYFDDVGEGRYAVLDAELHQRLMRGLQRI